jgi:uncharacterized membrane protein
MRGSRPTRFAARIERMDGVHLAFLIIGILFISNAEPVGAFMGLVLVLAAYGLI